MTTVLVPLAELCQMDRRHVRSGDEGASNLPFVGVEHVVAGNGVIDFDSDSRVGSQKSAAFRFDARHVLYGKLRPYLNKVATPDFAGKCSTELIPLLPREGVDRDYLAHLLRRRETVDFVMAAVTGSRTEPWAVARGWWSGFGAMPDVSVGPAGRNGERRGEDAVGPIRGLRASYAGPSLSLRSSRRCPGGCGP